MKKLVFFVFLILLLLLVPVTILQTTPLALVLKNSATITNSIQRFFGLAAFTLLFVQLILGAFMGRLSEKLGTWVFKFHFFEGGLIYTLALAHPLSLILFNHFVGIGWDPYRVFINACMLCNAPIYYYYTLGIVSFWLLTVVTFAAIYRYANPWFKANWRKFHVLNYIVFLLVGLHGFLIGSDFRVQPFYSFAVLAYAIVAGVVAFIEIPRLYRNYTNWLRG